MVKYPKCNPYSGAGVKKILGAHSVHGDMNGYHMNDTSHVRTSGPVYIYNGPGEFEQVTPNEHLDLPEERRREILNTPQAWHPYER